jgi:hypothetical protein
MSQQDDRDGEAQTIRSILNSTFRAPASQLPTFSAFQPSLSEAGLFWMMLEIESYTSLLSSRECTNIKAWKTIIVDREYDVYFRIRANGRSVPQFDLKVYVVFPHAGECQFRLEDWADGARGFVNGRVVGSGTRFKCERLPTQRHPPRPINYYPDELISV